MLGILPLMQKFYETAGLHGIWEADRQAYAALTGRYHEALAKMLFDTEIYLKLPSSRPPGARIHGVPRSHGRARDKPTPGIMDLTITW